MAFVDGALARQGRCDCDTGVGETRANTAFEPGPTAPPPTTSSGRSARSSNWTRAARSLSSGAGEVAGKAPNRAAWGSVACESIGTGPSRMSWWMMSATGPGRPVVASRNARRTIGPRSSILRTVPTHFVTGTSSASWSSACEVAPRCHRASVDVGSSLTRASTGIDELNASPNPDGNLAVPGPTVASHTPTVRVRRAYASAA